MKSPTAKEIRKARHNAGLSQSAAAELIYKGKRVWQNWESPEGSAQHRTMSPAYWELWQLKVKETDK